MEIVSLGSNCAVAYQLKELQLRNQAYPFDWAKVSLNSLIKVLENNFTDYCQVTIKKLSENHLMLDTKEPSYLVANRYGITMAHEIVDQQNLDLFASFLIRRVERFKKLDNPKFVRLETANLSPEQMVGYNKLVELLDKYFTSYQLIVISKINPINPKIKWIKLGSFDERWQYPELDWSNIFI